MPKPSAPEQDTRDKFSWSADDVEIEAAPPAGHGLKALVAKVRGRKQASEPRPLAVIRELGTMQERAPDPKDDAPEARAFHHPGGHDHNQKNHTRHGYILARPELAKMISRRVLKTMGITRQGKTAKITLPPKPKAKTQAAPPSLATLKTQAEAKGLRFPRMNMTVKGQFGGASLYKLSPDGKHGFIDYKDGSGISKVKLADVGLADYHPAHVKAFNKSSPTGRTDATARPTEAGPTSVRPPTAKSDTGMADHKPLPMKTIHEQDTQKDEPAAPKAEAVPGGAAHGPQRTYTDQEKALVTAPLTEASMTMVQQSSVNDVYTATVPGVGKVIIKPDNGLDKAIYRHGVKAGKDNQRERSAYVINKVMGDLVPMPEQVYRDSPYGKAGVQTFVEGAQPFAGVAAIEFRQGRMGTTLAEKIASRAELRRFALFDATICNLDRHAANALYDPAKPIGQRVISIDHGLSNPETHIKTNANTLFVDAANHLKLMTLSATDKASLTALKDRRPEVEAAMAPLGATAINNLYARVDKMLETGQILSSTILTGRDEAFNAYAANYGKQAKPAKKGAA